MKTLSFELLPGQSHLVSHYEGFSDMTIDRQGNSLNIEFDSPSTSRLTLSSKPCLILKSVI